MRNKPEDGERPEIETWSDMLAAGAAEDVLLATEACLEDDPQDEVAALYRVYALTDLGLAIEAYEGMTELAAAFGEDPFVQAELARSAFIASRFPIAAAAAQAALEGDEEEALAIWVQALLAEREDDYERADALFARAAQLEPEAFPPRIELSDDEFARVLSNAIKQLPEPFQQALTNVALIEEPVPSDAVLATLEEEDRDPTILGLYVGKSLDQGSVLDEVNESDLPPTIYVYRRNLERAGRDPDEIREQIAITLFHELGHHLGFDEEAMADLGLE